MTPTQRPMFPKEYQCTDKQLSGVNGVCWEWNAYRNPAGYGEVRVNYRLWLAHRYSYHCNTGDIPEGLVIMHTCDNPACINPEHLLLGTHAHNNADTNAKGRGNQGGRNGQSKLSQQQVQDIRRRVAEGEKSIRLSEEFRVNRSCISKIVNQSSWKEVI